MDVLHALTGAAALLHAALFFLAGWGFGATLLGRRTPAGGTGALVRVAVGTGALGYVAFALGILGLLHGWLLLGVLLAGGALAVRRLPGRFAAATRGRLLTGSGAGGRVFLGIGAAAAGFALLGALLPEVEYDALWYHLAFPARYLQHARLVDIPWEHMSPTPQHVELLYAYGLVFGDARTAKLIHLGFGLLAAAWAGLLAAHYVGRRWAPLAAALFLTAPTVLWEMTTAYNELPLAFVGTGAAALLLEWRRRPARHLLLLAGTLLGIGLAGKHLAFFFLAPLALYVLLAPAPGAARPPRQRVAEAALLCGVALVVALPWYVRAWVYTGNPLFPMFYEPLTTAGVEIRRWDAQAERGWAAAMARYGAGRGVLDLLLVPWRTTWDGVRFAGSLGPAWLLFLPLLALVWHRVHRGVRLLAALGVVYYLLWISPISSFQVRYLVPVLPVAAVVAAAVVRALGGLFAEAGLPTAARLLPAAVATVLLLNLPPLFPLHNARAGWIPHTFHAINPGAVRTALGHYGVDRFLADRLEPYRATRFIDEALPPDARIVWFAEAAHFYVRRDVVMDYSRCVADGVWGATPGDEGAAHHVLRAAGITHVLWDKTRTDLDRSRFALATALFREHYATLLYDDPAVELYELRAVAGAVPPAPVLAAGERAAACMRGLS